MEGKGRGEYREGGVQGGGRKEWEWKDKTRGGRK